METIGLETFAIMLLTGAAAVMTLIGGILGFVLKDIKKNQYDIWGWAREETAKIERMINDQNVEYRREVTDLRRALRHGLRSMLCHVLDLAKLVGPKGGDLVESIEDQLKRESEV